MVCRRTQGQVPELHGISSPPRHAGRMAKARLSPRMPPGSHDCRCSRRPLRLSPTRNRLEGTVRYLLLALFLVSPAFAQTANQTAVVRWNAVTQYTDGSAITDPVSYNVYIGTSGPGSEVSTPDTVSILSAKIGNYASGQARPSMSRSQRPSMASKEPDPPRFPISWAAKHQPRWAVSP